MTTSVQCQHRHKSNQCTKRTSNPAGLCHLHVNSGVMLNDINNGTRKLPVMTAIPQLGGARAESLDPDLDINDNRAVVNKMAEDFKEGKNQEAAETPAKKSFGQRIRGMFS